MLKPMSSSSCVQGTSKRSRASSWSGSCSGSAGPAVEDPADAVELLVRHDADAAKRVGDRLALKFKGVRVRVLRKHALVVGEAAFDELAHEGDVAKEKHLES